MAEIKPPSIHWSGRLEPECGIAFEVVKWGKSYCNQDCWNTYLYIHNKEMVDYLWSDKCRKYEWGEVWEPKEILEELDWNGGQTFYEQVIAGNHRYIKIGDDYQHLWDEREVYDEQMLYNRIKYIAEQLLEAWNRRANDGERKES